MFQSAKIDKCKCKQWFKQCKHYKQCKQFIVRSYLHLWWYFHHRHHLDSDPSIPLLPPYVNVCLCGASHNNHHCPYHPFTIPIIHLQSSSSIHNLHPLYSQNPMSMGASVAPHRLSTLSSCNNSSDSRWAWSGWHRACWAWSCWAWSCWAWGCS